MIGFIKRLMHRGGGGWVRVRPGEIITLRPGQKFDTLHHGGVVVTGWVWGLKQARRGSDGRLYTSSPTMGGDVWSHFIKAYRPYRPEPPAEAVETRARRENQWRDWARDPHAPATAPEGPARRKKVRG